jgi:hypothetical protein
MDDGLPFGALATLGDILLPSSYTERVTREEKKNQKLIGISSPSPANVIDLQSCEQSPGVWA